MKTLTPAKATLLDDDAFRLLALPFGGPIPFPGAPRGADLDRQWFSERTDFGPPLKGWVDVDWHHGNDPWANLGKAHPQEIVGKAGELEWDDDGGWVKVWLDAGRRRTRLIKALAEAAEGDDEVNIYGSSEGIQGSGRVRTIRGQEVGWRPRLPGEITRWRYAKQTLSTSPQNTKSILVPVKATLEDIFDGTLAADDSYRDALARWLDDLVAHPAPDPTGNGEAKAGRVLSGRNEARLREAHRLLDAPFDASLRADAERVKEAQRAIDKVLDELNDRESLMTPVEI